MRAFPRQRQQYFFAGILAFIGAVNLLFFFILYQPARSEYYRLLDSIQHLRGDIGARKQKIDQLEHLNAQLSTLEQDRERLFKLHFIPRNAGWSEILPKLNTMIQEARVDNTQKSYTIDQTPQYALYSVKIRIPVQGGYPNVVNLIRDLENSQTFFIINSIDVHRNTSTGTGASDIGLDLNLETFFYQ